MHASQTVSENNGARRVRARLDAQVSPASVRWLVHERTEDGAEYTLSLPWGDRTCTRWPVMVHSGPSSMHVATNDGQVYRVEGVARADGVCRGPAAAKPNLVCVANASLLAGDGQWTAFTRPQDNCVVLVDPSGAEAAHPMHRADKGAAHSVTHLAVWAGVFAYATESAIFYSVPPHDKAPNAHSCITAQVPGRLRALCVGPYAIDLIDAIGSHIAVSHSEAGAQPRYMFLREGGLMSACCVSDNGAAVLLDQQGSIWVREKDHLSAAPYTKQALCLEAMDGAVLVKLKGGFVGKYRDGVWSDVAEVARLGAPEPDDKDEDMAEAEAEVLVPVAWELLLAGTEASPQGEWKRFDEHLSGYLERAYQDGEPGVTFEVSSMLFEVVFASMSHIDNTRAEVTKLRRQVPSSARLERARSLLTSLGAWGVARSPADFSVEQAPDADAACVICLEPLFTEAGAQAGGEVVHMKACRRHAFHAECLAGCYSEAPDPTSGEGHLVCPVCSHVYGTRKGAMPHGEMVCYESAEPLEGHPASEGHLHVVYKFLKGVCGPECANPGAEYPAIQRECYLPNNPEGRAAMRRLELAFERRLTFKVGRSSTTGADNVLVWAIHHKTRPDGGPAVHGYPDPTYLERLSSELDQLGVPRLE